MQKTAPAGAGAEGAAILLVSVVPMTWRCLMAAVVSAMSVVTATVVVDAYTSRCCCQGE